MPQTVAYHSQPLPLVLSVILLCSLSSELHIISEGLEGESLTCCSQGKEAEGGMSGAQKISVSRSS